MFSRIPRLALRRCVHTAPPRASRSFNRLQLVLSASAAAAVYLALSHSIALDSNEHPSPSIPASEKPTAAVASPSTTDAAPPAEGEPSGEATSAGESQEGGASGGAFNPVTGEINWDCPCLGGMAHGPCGPQFREAFSCFVFSEDEPKGINCVDKFKAMQNCFREHPEIYADEIDDDDDVPAPATQGDSPPLPDSTSNETLPSTAPQPTTSESQNSQPSETSA